MSFWGRGVRCFGEVSAKAELMQMSAQRVVARIGEGHLVTVGIKTKPSVFPLEPEGVLGQLASGHGEMLAHDVGLDDGAPDVANSSLLRPPGAKVAKEMI